MRRENISLKKILILWRQIWLLHKIVEPCKDKPEHFLFFENIAGMQENYNIKFLMRKRIVIFML